jgi:hypothetical protein
MATTPNVGGFSDATKHTATLRLQSDGSLDAELTADGAKTVLDLIKEVAADIASAAPGDPIPSEWTELLRVPADGTTVTISLGVLAKHTDPV